MSGHQEVGRTQRWGAVLLVRLAGVAVTVSGLAFMGWGTTQGGAHSSPLRIILASQTFTCDTSQRCIKPSQVPTTAGSYKDASLCTDQAALANPNEDYWHFVIPESSGYAFSSDTNDFTATFATNNNIHADHFGHSGKFAFVLSPAGAELDWAYANNVVGIGTGDFNLSGTCPATVTTTSTATQTSTVTSTVTSTTTVTQPTTVTTTTTVTQPASTVTSTKTETETETVTQPTTVTETSTKTVTATSTVTSPTTETVTETKTETSPTTVTATTTVTHNHTVTKTVTEEGTTTTVTQPGTTTTVTETQTITGAVAGVSTSGGSTAGSGAASVPSTGADVDFGLGLLLVVAGGGLIAVAPRLRRKNARP